MFITNQKILRIVLASFLLVSSICITAKPKTSVGTIHYYMPYKPFFFPTSTYTDDRYSGKLGCGKEIRVQVKPGHHLVSVRPGPLLTRRNKDLFIRSGGHIYLQVDRGYMVGENFYRIKRVNARLARKEMQH